MRTVPILAAYGGYRFGSANRTHPELGDYNCWACIPDIRGSPATQHAGSLSPIVRETMAKDGTYKAKLPEEHHYLPKRRDESVGTDPTMRRY